MDGINNYGFRIINSNNPSIPQNLNTLAINYCMLPASRMAKRIATFRENNPGDNRVLSKVNSQALLMFTSNQKDHYFSNTLTFNETNNALQCLASKLANATNLNLELLSAIDLTTGTTATLNSNCFTYSYNKANNFVTIKNIDSSFVFSNYTLIFNLTGLNSIYNQYITYTLRY